MMLSSAERRRRLMLILASGGGGWREWVSPAAGTAATLASLGVPASGVCTMLWSGVLTTVGTGTQQVLLTIDDATLVNQFLVRNVGGNSILQSARVLATVLGGATIGILTGGAPFKTGAVIPGDGSIRACQNGGAVSAVTGGPTSGLTHFRIGNSSAGTGPAVGSTYLVRVLPGVALSDADLQAAVNAL